MIIEEYLSFISNPHFPCVAAKAALSHGQIKCMVADHMECPADDKTILDFVYSFVDDYRAHKTLYHSATIIFKGPHIEDEKHFDRLMWQRLQALSDADARQFQYDERVSADPASPDFSFSLKKEAFFVIGLHPASSRQARRFTYPTLVFNPHEQFDILRLENHYESMKATVRKRDIQLSGSINPMLDDFGSSSEARQYSGRAYDNNWQCPLHNSHGNTTDHTTP